MKIMEDFIKEKKRLSDNIDYLKSMLKALEMTLHLHEQENIVKSKSNPRPFCAVCADVRLQLDGMNATLEDIQSKLQSPKMLCVFYGGTSNGKSTTINALLGKCILPSSMGSTTQVVTRIAGTSQDLFSFKCDGQEGVCYSANEFKTAVSSKASKRSVVRVSYPWANCPLLQQNIEIIDTPEVGADVELDEVVQRECLDADVVVLVLHSVKTITLAESEFVGVIKKRFGSANVFLVWNWWDACARDENDQSRVREQHLENSQMFFKKMNDDFSENGWHQRVHFVSAFEALSQRDDSVEDEDLEMINSCIQLLAEKQNKSKADEEKLKKYQRRRKEKDERMDSFKTFESTLLKDIQDHASKIKIKSGADGTKTSAIRLQQTVGSALQSHFKQLLTYRQFLKKKREEKTTLENLTKVFQENEKRIMQEAVRKLKVSLKKLQQKHVAIISTSVKSITTSQDIKGYAEMKEKVDTMLRDYFLLVMAEVKECFNVSIKDQYKEKLLQTLQARGKFPMDVGISCRGVEVVSKETLHCTTFTFRQFFQYCGEKYYRMPLAIATPLLIPLRLTSLICKFNGWDENERIKNLGFVLKEIQEANLDSFYEKIQIDCVLQFETQLEGTFVEIKKCANECLTKLDTTLSHLKEKETELFQKMEVHSRIKFYSWMTEQRIRNSSINADGCDESMYC